MDVFFFKKLVAAYVMPIPVIILFLLSGLGFYLFNKNRAGMVCTAMATALLVVITSTPLPASLLKNIERQYPQFDLSRRVSEIVVLGCGHTNDAALPLTAQLQACSLYRVAEAVRIYRQNPGARIIVTGGAFLEEFTTAEMHRRMLVALGVPDDAIVKLDTPKDTEQEAAVLSQQLQGKPFALVTSASHLPRSIRLLEQRRLAPIAAPAEYLVKESDSEGGLVSGAPSTGNILKIERWWYETLAQTWISLKEWYAS